MSHKGTYWAFRQQLPAFEKLVLIVLADRHNSDTNRCDPSIARIAVDAGMSKDAVMDTVRKLVKKGLVEVQNRTSESRKITNSYSFNFGLILGPNEEGVVAHSHHPSGSQPLGGSGSQPLKPVSIKPVIEPSAIKNKRTILNSGAEESKNDSPVPLRNSHIKRKKNKRPGGPDPRHQPFIGALEKYWDWMNSESESPPAMPFSPRTAKKISEFLDANPKITLEQIQDCLNNRAHSDGISPTEDPIAWIAYVLKFLAGPMDRFGKLKQKNGDTED